MEAELSFKGNGSYFSLKMKYNSRMISKIKALIPPNMRRWEQAKRQWYIGSAYYDSIIDVLQKNGVDFNVAGVDKKTSFIKLEDKEFTVEHIGKEIYWINVPGDLISHASGYNPIARIIPCASISDNCYIGYTFERKLFLFPKFAMERYKNLHGVLDSQKVPNINSNDLFKVLGVNKNSRPEEIKNAFRKLSLIHHPDRGGSVEDFLKIKKAYEVLGNELTRRKYLGILSFMEKTKEKVIKPEIDFQLPFNCARVCAHGFLWLGLFVSIDIKWAKKIVKGNLMMTSVKNGNTYDIKWIPII